MEAFLRQSITLSCHATSLTIYDLFALSSRFSMGRWTQYQWGGLIGAVALNALRPSIQKPVDDRIGMRNSRLLFDLTPLLVIGVTQWQATRQVKGALLTGSFFAICHKFINWQQHSMARNHVWGSSYSTDQKHTPRNYYEELALQQGLARKASQELSFALNEGSEIYALALIHTGRVVEGIAIFKKHQSTYGIRFGNPALLEAQLSFYTEQNDFESASRAIQTMEQALDGKSYHERFPCYEVMISTYIYFRKEEALLTLLLKMEKELPTIEQQETTCSSRFCDYDYRHRVITAKGYCLLGNQWGKVIELMSQDRIPVQPHQNPFSELFEVYFKVTYGTEAFDPQFADKLTLSPRKKLQAQNDFNRQAALACLGADNFAGADEWIAKVTFQNYLEEIIKALLKKDELARAEGLARSVTNRDIYHLIGQAYLNADNRQKALEMARECRNEEFQASVYLTLRTLDTPYEDELRSVLSTPRLPLHVRVKVLHALEEDFEAAISSEPILDLKAFAYLTLFQITKDEKYIEMTFKAAESAPKSFIRAFLIPVCINIGKFAEAFVLVRRHMKATIISYSLVADWIANKSIGAEDFFRDMKPSLETTQFRVGIAQSLQRRGEHQAALTILAPLSFT